MLLFVYFFIILLQIIFCMHCNIMLGIPLLSSPNNSQENYEEAFNFLRA